MQPILSKFVPSAVSLRPSARHARSIYSYGMAERPKAAKIQLPPPGDGKGYWHYERDFSRDLRYSKPQLNANNFLGVLLEGFNHKDLYLLLALPITALILGAYVTLRSAFKIELWIDRTTYTPPWDWARVHNKYWKMPTQLYDPTGVTHERLSTMEKLEDGMVEAAQKRGTRDGRGYLVGK